MAGLLPVRRVADRRWRERDGTEGRRKGTSGGRGAGGGRPADTRRTGSEPAVMIRSPCGPAGMPLRTLRGELPSCSCCVAVRPAVRCCPAVEGALPWVLRGSAHCTGLSGLGDTAASFPAGGGPVREANRVSRTVRGADGQPVAEPVRIRPHSLAPERHIARHYVRSPPCPVVEDPSENG